MGLAVKAHLSKRRPVLKCALLWMENGARGVHGALAVLTASNFEDEIVIIPNPPTEGATVWEMTWQVVIALEACVNVSFFGINIKLRNKCDKFDFQFCQFVGFY